MSSPGIQNGRIRSQQQQQPDVSGDPTKYLVKSGDNLTRIAERLGVDLQSLIAANPQIKNPDLIFPNQVLNVPQAQQAQGTGETAVDPNAGRTGTPHGDAFETGGGRSHTGGGAINEEGQQFRQNIHTDPEARAQFNNLRQQAHMGGHGANTVRGGGNGHGATNEHDAGAGHGGEGGHGADAAHGDGHHGAHTLRNNDGRTNDLNGGLHENGGTGHTAMRGHAGQGTGMLGQTGGTAINRSASYSRGGGVVNRETSRTDMDLNRNTEFNRTQTNTRDNNRGVTTQQRNVTYRDSHGGEHSNFNRTRQLDSGYRTESSGGRSVENKTLGNGNTYRVTNGESQTTATNRDGTRSVTRNQTERDAVRLNNHDTSAQQRMAQIDRKLDGFRGSSGNFKPENAQEAAQIRNLQAERAQLQQRVRERNPDHDAGNHDTHAHRGPHVDATANFAAIEKKTAWHGAVTAGSDPTMMKDQTGAAGEVHVLAARGQAGAAAGMNLKTGQLHAGAQAGVELDVIGASGRAQVGTANSVAGQGYVRGTANVGANATVGGSVVVDPRNLTAKVGVGGEAFAGAQVKGAVGYQNRYVGAEVEGRAQAGAGVAARAEIGMERGVFRAKADLGACLGVGGRVTVNINVNVGAMYQDSKAAVSNAVSSGWNTVRSWF